MSRKVAAYRWVAQAVSAMWVEGMADRFEETEAEERRFVEAVEGWDGSAAGAREVREAGEALIERWRELR